MTNNKWLYMFLALVAAYFAGSHYGSSVKTEIREVEKEVIKRTYIVRDNADGSKETIYIEEERKEISRDVKKTPIKKDWIVGLSTKLPFQETYTLSVDRRIIGNIYVGGYGSTDAEFGVSLRLLF